LAFNIIALSCIKIRHHVDDDDGMTVDVDRYLLRDGPAKMLCGEALKMVVTDNGTVFDAWLYT
jgi:hypothetical protein